MSSMRAFLTLLGTLTLASIFMYERGMVTSWTANSVTFWGLCLSAAAVGAFAGFAMAEHMNAANLIPFAFVPPVAFTYGYFRTLSLEVVMQALTSVFLLVYLSFFAAYVLVCTLLRGMEVAARTARPNRSRYGG